MAETEPTDEERTEDVTEQPLTELLEQLGRQMSALLFYEARLAASRHKDETRLAVGGAFGALVAALAFLTAFALANVAAVRALSSSLAAWLAPLVLAGAWAVLAAAIALVLRARAKRIRAWKVRDAEEARAEAAQAVRETLDQLAPAITKEIALAAVPMAGDMASGVIDAGEEILDTADEILDDITDDIPGGGVVNQIWDVALMPGRLGIRVATTVLKRDHSPD
jgi:Putative Actinobacterial Holin-X, holin superfamily III